MKALVVLYVFAFPLDAERVLAELSRFSVTQKGIVADSGAFAEPYIRRLCQREISRQSTKVLDVYIYQNARALLPKPDHLAYETWRRLYDQSVQSKLGIAEMISMGKDSVVRIRNTEGALNRFVLSGRDPLKIELPGMELEIVYIALGPASVRTLQRVDVYIRTASDLAAVDGQRLLHQLAPFFEGFEVSVFVRNDSWFIYEPTYPFYNPFIPNASPPAKEEYEATRTLKCNLLFATVCRIE